MKTKENIQQDLFDKVVAESLMHREGKIDAAELLAEFQSPMKIGKESHVIRNRKSSGAD